jgi:hypothetical protein
MFSNYKKRFNKETEVIRSSLNEKAIRLTQIHSASLPCKQAASPTSGF